MSKFAAGTTVSVEQSQAEIEKTALRYGATLCRPFCSTSAWSGPVSMIAGHSWLASDRE